MYMMTIMNNDKDRIMYRQEVDGWETRKQM